MTVSPATRLLDDPLVRGREALARGDWEQARECFAAAGETPAALDGLAWTGWWLADERLTIDARERAYRAYRAAGDDGAAARVAAWLATDHREFRGEEAVARGWLRRAQRLISGLEGETADHGWVKLIDADLALNLDLDAPRAERLSLEAAQLGQRLGVADLEAVGLAQAGIALVLQGRVKDGMARLDEASAIAVGEDLQLPISTGWARLLPDLRVRRDRRLRARRRVVSGDARLHRPLGRTPRRRDLPQRVRARARHQRRLAGGRG